MILQGNHHARVWGEWRESYGSRGGVQVEVWEVGCQQVSGRGEGEG